jgi:hypothetical protein
VFYAKSKTTGKEHILGSLLYIGGTPSAVAYATVLPVGTYDILYQRGYNSSAGYVFQNAADETFSNGYQVIQKNVVIVPGTQPLQLNVSQGQISGAMTLNGAFPPQSPSSADPMFFAVSHDSGKLHLVATLNYDGSGNVTGGNGYSTVLPVGTYDIVYQRGWSSASGYVSENVVGDPFPNGYQTIQKNVVITTGSQTLALNVNASLFTGNVTFDGGQVPKSTSSLDPIFVALSRDTKKEHYFSRLDYDASGNPVAGTTYSTRLPAGTYDLLYERGWNGVWVNQTTAGDAVPNGHNHLAACVSVP